MHRLPVAIVIQPTSNATGKQTKLQPSDLGSMCYHSVVLAAQGTGHGAGHSRSLELGKPFGLTSRGT